MPPLLRPTNERTDVPVYKIKQYERHVQEFRVKAESEAAAIAKLFNVGGTVVDGGTELLEVDTDHGLSVDEYPELADELLRMGVIRGSDAVIGSIHNIEIDEDADEADFDDEAPADATS